MIYSPLVSIGMPVHNGEPFIAKAIESLLNQTHTDFDLIISDNFSTDNTERICKSYQKNDNRIIYFRQKENKGSAFNYKFVLEQSRGSLFVWAAHDDFWNKNFIKEGVNFLLNNPSYDVWSSSCINIDSSGNEIEKLKTYDRFTCQRYSFTSICKYALEPENIGKANMYYSMHRRENLNNLTNEYFIKDECPWTDYVFNIFTLYNSNFYGSNKHLFYKRINCSFNKTANYIVRKRNPWKTGFSIQWSRSYIVEHFKALKRTKYRYIVVLILLIRLLIIVYFKIIYNISSSFHAKNVAHNFLSLNIKGTLFSLKRLFANILNII